MTIRSADYLISRFEIGDLPTATDFADLIDSLAPNAKILDTVADLIAQPAPVLDVGDGLPGVLAFTRGASSASDEGGRTWLWNPISTRTADSANVALPAGHVTAGRWEAVMEGDTVHPEWWGLRNQDNIAFALNAACHWAWQHGYTRVAPRRACHDMAIWGVMGWSNVTLDMLVSQLRPYVPPAPEGGVTEHVLTLFGNGEAVRVPEAFVELYNLRGTNNVNPMVNDPLLNIDHRALHPAYPGGGNGNYFIEFYDGEVFDPRGYRVRTNGTAALNPGDRVWLFRPYYETAINQAMAAPGIVRAVEGEYVYFERPIGKPFARRHCRPGSTTTQTVWGGIALCPPNFMVENWHVKNLEVDCSEVDPAVHCVTLWRGGQALDCSISNFKITGGEYYFCCFPKGRENQIGPGEIHGGGQFLANEQGNTLNRFHDLICTLATWAVTYPTLYPSMLHFGERMSVEMERVALIAPDPDANTENHNGADLTTGSVGNRVVGCTFHNVINNYCRLTQIDGYGDLEFRDNTVTGTAVGPILSLGLSDNLGDGSVASQMVALHCTGNTFDLQSKDPTLTQLDNPRWGDLCFSTPAEISGNRFTLNTYGTTTPWPYSQITNHSIQYAGTPNGELTDATLQYLHPRLVIEGNRGLLPELRWRRFTVADLVTSATVDAANNRITLPNGADTAVSLMFNEVDQWATVLFARLTLSDGSGAGGTTFFQGRISIATTASPTAPSLVTNSPALTTVTIAATTARQTVVLPMVRNSAVGYVPVGAWEISLMGTTPGDTVGDLRLHGIEVLFVGAK